MKLGKPEPYNPNNPDHKDPTKYKLFQGSVWDHTISALRSLKLIDPITALAVLLHDVGKINTFALDDKGKITYHAHAKHSMDIIDDIADRLKLDTKTRKSLIFAAGKHMDMHNMFDMKNSKIVNLIMDDNWDVLLNVAIADDKARLHLYDPKVWEDIKKKIEILTIKYKNKKSQEAIRKVVNGQLVMKIRKLKQGKEVGEIIKKTMEWILDNNIDPKNSRQIHKYIKQLEI